MQATSALLAFGPLVCSTIHLAGCLLSGRIGVRKNSQADCQTEVRSVYDSVFSPVRLFCKDVWLICPMVARRVYFWFGRSPLNCQLIMQRKCYRQLFNFFQPLFQHRGTYLCLISQKLHTLNSDSALIFLWSYTSQEKGTCLHLTFWLQNKKVWLQNKKADTMNRGGQHIVLILISNQFTCI